MNNKTRKDFVSKKVKFQSSNNNPKKNWHITVKGYLPKDNPIQWEDLDKKLNIIKLFYCEEQGEKNQTEHTHIGLEIMNPIRKIQLINSLLEIMPHIIKSEQVDVNSHHSFQTIIGYHYGFGEKKPCEPKPVWVKPNDFRVDEWVEVAMKSKNAKSSRAKASRNAQLLEGDIEQLVSNGEVSLISVPNILKAREMFNNELTIKKNLEQAMIFYPYTSKKKQRHLYFCLPTNSGKTATIKYAQNVLGIIPFYWNCNETFQSYKGERFVIFEEFTSKSYKHLQLSELNALADGDKKISRKGQQDIIPPKNIVVIIISNFLIDFLYPNATYQALEAFKSRFNVISDQEGLEDVWKDWFDCNRKEVIEKAYNLATNDSTNEFSREIEEETDEKVEIFHENDLDDFEILSKKLRSENSWSQNDYFNLFES